MTGIECAFSGRVGQTPTLKESKAGKGVAFLNINQNAIGTNHGQDEINRKHVE
jgi:hypothetical protein